MRCGCSRDRIPKEAHGRRNRDRRLSRRGFLIVRAPPRRRDGVRARHVRANALLASGIFAWLRDRGLDRRSQFLSRADQSAPARSAGQSAGRSRAFALQCRTEQRTAGAWGRCARPRGRGAVAALGPMQRRRPRARRQYGDDRHAADDPRRGFDARQYFAAQSLLRIEQGGAAPAAAGVRCASISRAATISSANIAT